MISHFDICIYVKHTSLEDRFFSFIIKAASTVPVLPFPALQWTATFPPAAISLSIASTIWTILATGIPSNSIHPWISCLIPNCERNPACDGRESSDSVISLVTPRSTKHNKNHNKIINQNENHLCRNQRNSPNSLMSVLYLGTAQPATLIRIENLLNIFSCDSDLRTSSVCLFVIKLSKIVLCLIYAFFRHRHFRLVYFYLEY